MSEEDFINALIEQIANAETRRDFLRSQGRDIQKIPESMIDRLAYVVSQWKDPNPLNHDYYPSACGCMGPDNDAGKVTGLCSCAINALVAEYKFEIALKLVLQPKPAKPDPVVSEFDLITLELKPAPSDKMVLFMRVLRRAITTMPFPVALKYAQEGGKLEIGYREDAARFRHEMKQIGVEIEYID